MKSKIISLSDAVQKYVKDRSMVASGGFPMSRQSTIFCKEILRQKKAGKIAVNDLFWVEPGIGFGGDMLIAEGVIDSVISTFTGHERPGLSKVTRDSLEKGIPRKIKWEDETNLSLNLKIMAGALNIPFIPSNSCVWGDLRKPGLWDQKLPYQKDIIMEDPYGSGKKVALLQAVNPDVTVVHVNFADEKGNGIILGSVYYDYWMGRCGKNIILIADHIVDTAMCRQYPNLVTIPGAGVDAVVPWYMGAWPTNSPGIYGEDIEHMTSFIKTCRDKAALREYLDKYVYSWNTHEEYLKLIDNKEKLENNPANVLAEPFKQWIKY
ncbi:CoA-transferase [Clostridium sp. JN-1]|uniref:CoA transferase subunit A n=1 Tax=Clostridium sp. JN-1 TaxID=2483110 RepID=UPI000F0B65C8|nr:CoA-transferase [Clostridium sp. JN-1]